MTQPATGLASRQILRDYAQPRLVRSLLDIGTSIVPYLSLSIVIYGTLGVSAPLTVALMVLAAGFLVRTYILFHDCAHGSLLRGRRANEWLGSVLALMVLTPFARWRHEHLGHHATAGDLDRRGIGDVPTITLAEYEA